VEKVPIARAGVMARFRGASKPGGRRETKQVPQDSSVIHHVPPFYVQRKLPKSIADLLPFVLASNRFIWGKKYKNA
jgi:hypothetical protein